MTSSRRTRLALVGVLLLGLVVAIGVFEPTGLFAPFDRALMTAAGEGRGGPVGAAVTRLMILLSILGDTTGRLFLMFAICAWLYRRRRLRAALWLIGAVMGMTLINNGLKAWFQESRPQLIPHLDDVTSYSFPSGHASGNMVFFGAIAVLEPFRWVIAAAALMIVLIGISRVWLGVHWPSDVAAGWIAGVAWLALWSALTAFPSPSGSSSRDAP